MSVSEFMKDLPVYNKHNFTQFCTDSINRSCIRRPDTYIAIKDRPDEQVIVNEKTNILLRYLYHQWNREDKSVNMEEYEKDVSKDIERRNK